MGFKDSAILKNEEEIKDLQNTISAIKRESKCQYTTIIINYLKIWLPHILMSILYSCSPEG